MAMKLWGKCESRELSYERNGAPVSCLCLCVGRECEFREEKGEVFQPGELGVPGQGVLRRGEDLAPIVFHTRTIMTFELSMCCSSLRHKVDKFNRFKHTADAAEARRIIDAEIAVHEAAIRRLGHCRNTHSSIYRLPSEIVATIFLLVKSELGQGAVGHISGVCRQWREILLASPRIWSSINVSRVESVLELLKRSKSVPLKIKCEEYSCTEPHRRAAEAVMAEVGRIQDLNLSLPPKDLVDFYA
ncbi:ubiquitin protein [Salix suchowensis]|nr:ubiquitin protein [Salix suchowensis]